MDIQIKGIDSKGEPTAFFYNDTNDEENYIEAVLTPAFLEVRFVNPDGFAVETHQHRLEFITEASIL